MSPSPSNKILSPMTKCLGIAMHFILKYIYQIVVRFRMVTFLILRMQLQCANGVSYPQKCPTGLQWRNSLLVCDLPQNVGCTIAPGKKNSVDQC